MLFRNITATEDDPVETWGFEGVLTAIDRGGLRNWQRIVSAVHRDPHGEFAHQVSQAVDAAEDTGAAAWVAEGLRWARLSEKQRLGENLQLLLHEAELTHAEAADLLDTSRPRVSSYCSGTVTPSALVLDRIQRHVAQRRRHLAP